MNRHVMAVLCVTLLAMGCSKTEVKKKDEGASPRVSDVATQGNSTENILRVGPDTVRDLSLTTSIVKTAPGGDGVNLQGELQVNENAYAEVGVPITSRVVAIEAALGKTVSKGQVVALVQSPELGKARADYLTARARLELSQTALQRKQRLAAENIVAQREVQEAQANVKSAEADIQAAQSTLRSLGSSDAPSEGLQLALRSPINGTIIERTVVQGQMADPAKPLFKVADLSNLWLTSHAFEGDAVRVHAGTVARINFAALPGKSFRGKVSLVGKQVDMDSRTVLVRIEVANSGGLLRPGMSATAWVPLGNRSQDVIAVPAAAVQRMQDHWCVFIPRSKDTFEVRPVERGRDLGSEIEILSGLKVGDVVVVDGAFLLKAEAEKSKGEGEHDED
jgi:cobalt-zinc-cadmium efflux system membrane fusion protein